jgi:hypothetical protein
MTASEKGLVTASNNILTGRAGLSDSNACMRAAEAIEAARAKLEAASKCHPAAVQTLIEEALATFGVPEGVGSTK